MDTGKGSKYGACVCVFQLTRLADASSNERRPAMVVWPVAGCFPTKRRRILLPVPSNL
jgi:hypothetical protein